MMNNVIKAEIPMLNDKGILVSRKNADASARKMLDEHIEELKNEENLKGKDVKVWYEGPIEKKGNFVYTCLVEWQN